MIMPFDDASFRGFRANVKSKVGKGIQQYSTAHTTVDSRKGSSRACNISGACISSSFFLFFLEEWGAGFLFRDEVFLHLVPRWMTFIHRCFSAWMRSSHN